MWLTLHKIDLNATAYSTRWRVKLKMSKLTYHMQMLIERTWLDHLYMNSSS